MGRTSKGLNTFYRHRTKITLRLISSARLLRLGDSLVLQRENVSKHALKYVLKWIKQTAIKIFGELSPPLKICGLSLKASSAAESPPLWN
uniref:Uncharacterized protein n=1 Tax=Xiphophorus maculatus TaxID=8083 RepID=A0A3B5QCJ3_XIPMA